MRYSPERTARIARRIIERLVHQRLIECASQKAAIGALDRVIGDELAVEDRLDQEVRQLLKAHDAEFESGELDYGRMFQMVKRQIAKDRGLVL